MTDTNPPYDQDEEEIWPPHTGEFPDVSNLGNEAETEEDQANYYQQPVHLYDDDDPRDLRVVRFVPAPPDID